EIEFGWIVAGSEKARIVVMVVLKTRAEGRHHRQPVADIHRVVMLVIVATGAEAPIVRPVVLNQIDPECEKSEATPKHEGEFPVPEQQPDEAEAGELREHRPDGV